MPVKKSSSPEPDQGSLEATEELIRQRAYSYYEQRGRDDGHDLDDWLRAEAEIVGQKTSESAPAPEESERSPVAA
jgi:Protein of unknown function (DUF2934)